MAKKIVAPIEDDEDEVMELEDLETEADEAPAKGKAKGKAPAAEVDHGFGVRQLIALIQEKFGKEYSPREVRTLLRKLAREDGGIEREVVAGNKSRYVWTGADDPEVKVILKSIKGGSIEAAKKAALDKLKSDKAAKTAASAGVEGAKPKAKAKAAPVADDEDEDED